MTDRRSDRITDSPLTPLPSRFTSPIEHSSPSSSSSASDPESVSGSGSSPSRLDDDESFSPSSSSTRSDSTKVGIMNKESVQVPQPAAAPGPAGDLFWIERIIARSILPYPRPGGGVEKHYLVRWWGYGPEEDTWEPCHSLLSTVGDLIREFDSEDHPFTILSSRSIPIPPSDALSPLDIQPNPTVPQVSKVYKVQYGWSSRLIGHSPKAQVAWHTAAEIREMGISQRAFEDTERAWIAGVAPNPGLARGKVTTKAVRKIGVSQGKPGYKLIRILDEEIPEGKNGKRILSRKRVLVEYKIKRCRAKQQWFANSYLSTVFGVEQLKVAREEWQASRVYEEDEEVQKVQLTIPDDVGLGENEYEVERKRRIDENRALMVSLGLC